MSEMNLPPYLLQELPDISDAINGPLKTAQRIKYSCFDVSKTFIVFGATSGGIYIFNRHPCEFIQLIPNKDGAITRLAISSDENHIAFANGRGLVTISPCEQVLGHQSTVTSKEHQGNEVSAMVWGSSRLFIGDDVGKVSVLQMPNFIAKTMFQNSSQAIMNLDSRICQMDLKDCMLLVSTLTRCYICDTIREQYRQIGQKLRDGEYGACFVTTFKPVDNTVDDPQHDCVEVKKYSIVNNEEGFVVNEKLANVLIYCARPSSRLWEANINGTVNRTHQYKQVLGKTPFTVVTVSAYENENLSMEPVLQNKDGQSCSFLKIYNLNNNIIFSYTKDALYFLNTQNVDHTVWVDRYKDINACCAYKNEVYLWLQSGSIVHLVFVNLEKYILKCFLEDKYLLCVEICALYKDYFLSNDLSKKLHILVGLKEKFEGSNQALEDIGDVLTKFESLNYSEASQTKSGIYVVDNSYAQTLSSDDENSAIYEDKYPTRSPEALQAFKELSVTMSDKLSISKKILKEKWESVEEKMKNLKSENLSQESAAHKHIAQDTRKELPKIERDIVHKDSSHNTVHPEVEKKNKTLQSMYQHCRLGFISIGSNETNLTILLEDYSCDIMEIRKLLLDFEEYCMNVCEKDEAKYMSGKIFLQYISSSEKKDEILNTIIEDEVSYKYFVDCCINVNVRTHKHMDIGCECGFPLPYIRTNKSPEFTNLIDDFIEKQWTLDDNLTCYEICKRMPFLWRNILYLRRNEDLMKILRILLQMLDENLLHTFLPQFTLDTWESAIKLYATLYANICLNCGKKFDNIVVKDMLSWDDLGALMIKSIGGRNTVKIMERHDNLLGKNDLTMKFYHTCMMSCLYEKYDSTIVCQLTDTLYCAYDFEESRMEICKLLRSAVSGVIRNTALPIAVAGQSTYWGLSFTPDTAEGENSLENEFFDPTPSGPKEKTYTTLVEMWRQISQNEKAQTDCTLCGLPLVNEVLINDSGLWVFKCGHIFHGACLHLNKIKLCSSCVIK